MTATSPTTRPGRPAAPASWSPRRPRSTPRTGPTSGPPWPTGAGRGGPPWPTACRPHGTLVLAGLGHCGRQGSSAYSQSVLWAPSPVADVVSREMPAAMEPADIDAVRGRASPSAARSGRGRRARRGGDRHRPLLPPPPVPLRPDQPCAPTRYGTDRLRLTTEVARRRPVAPSDPAGAVPPAVLRRAGPLGRGDPRAGRRPRGRSWPTWSTSWWWSGAAPSRRPPTVPTPTPRPASTSSSVGRCGEAAAGRAAVVLQGSMVDPGDGPGRPRRRGRRPGGDDQGPDRRPPTGRPWCGPVHAERARPCILCNQACQVRDNRNPVVSCVGEPRSGHETVEPPVEGTDPDRAGTCWWSGAGVAGLECARVLAARGHRVRVAERSRLGRRGAAGGGGGAGPRAAGRAGRLAESPSAGLSG